MRLAHGHQIRLKRCGGRDDRHPERIADYEKVLHATPGWRRVRCRVVDVCSNDTIVSQSLFRQQTGRVLMIKWEFEDISIGRCLLLADVI